MGAELISAAAWPRVVVRMWTAHFCVCARGDMGCVWQAVNANAGGEQGKNGEAQQGGLWANIHLLCDLLGGPLGQVGQLTQAPSSKPSLPP